mgnify:CR=1 FL=1
MDRWKTFSVVPEGGLIENLSPLVQGEMFPGSLTDARNVEPSPLGGYRRIKGYEKFDSTVVPGTGKVQAVFMFDDTCLAMRTNKWYTSTGGGWSSALLTMGSNPGTILVTRYNWSGTDNLIICDGVNAPVHFDGTTLTLMDNSATINGQAISTATANNIVGAQAVQEFHQHMFYSVDEHIRFSAPNNEGLVDGTGGSGEFITGSEKIGMAPWRKQLYCWGDDRIGTISGQNSTDFKFENVTHKVGVVEPRTIREMNGDIYYLAYDGVRTISGTVRNEDIELGSTTRGIPNSMESLNFRSSSNDVHAVNIRTNTQYRIFVGNSTSEDFEGEGLLGGIRLNSSKEVLLEWFKIKGINASCSDSHVHNNTEYVIHGSYDGYVYRQERGNDFDTANISTFIRFPYWSIHTPEIRKTMYKGKFYLIAESQIAPTLGYNYNYNLANSLQPPTISLSTGTDGFDEYSSPDSVYGTATFGEDYPIQADVNLIGSGDNVSFYLSSDDTLATWSVQSVVIEYGEDGRR